MVPRLENVVQNTNNSLGANHRGAGIETTEPSVGKDYREIYGFRRPTGKGKFSKTASAMLRISLRSNRCFCEEISLKTVRASARIDFGP
jgi:hypothetical protein